MRITGGVARGIPIKTATLKTLRPATDYMREAVFSSLGPLIQGNQILDLFAGTGAYGLEGMSRGAHSATLVEKNPQAIKLIKHNWQAVAKSMQAPLEKVQIVGKDIFLWSPPKGNLFNLIFLDPPYALTEEATYRKWLAQLPQWLAHNGYIILEMPGNHPAPDLQGLNVHKKIGKSGKQEPGVYIYYKQ